MDCASELDEVWLVQCVLRLCEKNSVVRFLQSPKSREAVSVSYVTETNVMGDSTNWITNDNMETL